MLLATSITITGAQGPGPRALGVPRRVGSGDLTRTPAAAEGQRGTVVTEGLGDALAHSTTGRQRALSKHDLLMVITQLSIMIRSGVDLAEAVRSIASRSVRPGIRQAMAMVYSSLISGKILSQALAEQTATFGGVTVASVAAGEASGRLPEVLARLSVLLRDELRLRTTLRSVISYPAVLFVVTMMVLAAMVFFVLPQFAGIYESSRAPTPFLTQCLLNGSKWMRGYWWAFGGGLVAAGFVMLRLFRSPSGRLWRDRAMFRWPFVRSISRSLLAGRMFRLQGAMLDSGVPMLEVLQLTRNAVGNACLEELTDQIEESVINGKGMATALQSCGCIPEGAAEMIGTAEANGQLGPVLQTVGEFYESEGEQELRDAVKIAEPAIIVGLGVVVGIIVLAVMLPLLDLSTAGSV